MNKQIFYAITVTMFVLLDCVLALGGCATKKENVTKELVSVDHATYKVPEGKKQKWESIQNRVKKE